jgi:hypothetical protein
VSRWVPWMPLYRVRGQGTYKGGSPDRRVVCLREVLANLACRLCRLVEHIWVWLSSWSCGHVAAWCDMVLLCHPWWHYGCDGGSSAILCNVVLAVVFIIAS